MFDSEIAQGRHLPHLALQLFCVTTDGSQVRPRDSDFDRGGCPEVHNLADNVSRLEGKQTVGEFRRQGSSKLFLEDPYINPRFGPQGNIDNSLVRPTRPKENSINGIACGLSADITQADVHIALPRRRLNLV